MGEGNGEAGRTFHFSEIVINETQIEDEELYFTDQELMVVQPGSNPYLIISLFLCYFVLYLLGHEIVL